MAPDPTQEAAQAAAAAVSAAIVGTIGLHPQVIGFALTGATIGTLAAPAVGRWRALSLFIAVVALSSLVGTWAAARWYGGDRHTADVIAAVMAALFHPIFSAINKDVPSLMTWLIGRITGGKT